MPFCNIIELSCVKHARLDVPPFYALISSGGRMLKKSQRATQSSATQETVQTTCTPSINNSISVCQNPCNEHCPNSQHEHLDSKTPEPNSDHLPVGERAVLLVHLHSVRRISQNLHSLTTKMNSLQTQLRQLVRDK